MGRYAKQKPTLKQLLGEKASQVLPLTEDTMTAEEVRRLRPLAWLIRNQDYTLKEVIRCHMAYDEQRSSIRAEEILDIIRKRDRQKDKNKV